MENGVLVREYNEDYVCLTEEERADVLELLIEYQNYLDIQNKKKAKILTAEDYFSKEEYDLILRNQRDHELKYISVYNEATISTPENYEDKVRPGVAPQIEVIHINTASKGDFSIREFSLDWITTHTIQDFKKEGISIEDLEKLILEMEGFENTDEYDRINCCIERMREDLQ